MSSRPKEIKYIMFIDETGTSNGPNPFTITGVVFEYKYCIDAKNSPSQLKKELNKFKNNCFGKSSIHLHLKQIITCEEPFTPANGVTIKHLQNFWGKLPTFLSSLDMRIISVTVDKTKMGTYYNNHKDFYVVAFSHLMESFFSLLDDPHVTSARIVLESRDDYSNLKVQKAFFDIFNSGTASIDVDSNREKIKGFIFAKKDDSNYQSGLEIADLVCNPLNRARLGLVDADPKNVIYGKENKIFKALKNKLYIGNATLPDPMQDLRNWGFKKIPVVKRQRKWIDDSKEGTDIEFFI